MKDRIEIKDDKTWTCLIDIDKLIQDTEDTFINQLEGGDRKKAIKRLRYENCQCRIAARRHWKNNKKVLIKIPSEF